MFVVRKPTKTGFSRVETHITKANPELQQYFEPRNIKVMKNVNIKLVLLFDEHSL